MTQVVVVVVNADGQWVVVAMSSTQVMVPVVFVLVVVSTQMEGW